MLKCGFCNKEFTEDEFDQYVKHVQACGISYRVKQKVTQIKKTSQELEELKALKCQYETKKAEFKSKYPEVYRDFFSDENVKYQSYAPKEETEQESFYTVSEELKEILNQVGLQKFKIIKIF